MPEHRPPTPDELREWRDIIGFRTAEGGYRLPETIALRLIDEVERLRNICGTVAPFLLEEEWLRTGNLLLAASRGEVAP